MTTLDDLRAALDPEWLRETEEADATRLFARAGRRLGHEPLPGVPGWTAGQAGRAVLLGRLSPDEIPTIYHQGDATERLAVLKALPLLAIGDAAVPLLHDALRTNDARLVVISHHQHVPLRNGLEAMRVDTHKARIVASEKRAAGP